LFCIITLFNAIFAPKKLPTGAKAHARLPAGKSGPPKQKIAPTAPESFYHREENYK
jgi:hypothetical protein